MRKGEFFCYPALLFLITFGSSCATTIHGTTQKVPVSSIPSGARVTVNESTAYTTPTTLELSRSQPQILQFSLSGYHPEVVKLESVTSAAVMGNILLGGLIGWGVDAASGGQYRLVPESVQVTLRPTTSTESQPVVKAPSQTRDTLEDRLQQLRALREKDLINEEEYQSTRKRLLESTLTPTLSSKPTNSVSVVVKRDGAKLYAQQGDYSKVVTKLKQGEILEVLSQAFGMQDTLYQVRTQKGALGWVSYADVEKR